MKNSKRNECELVIPQSYQHLQQLAMKGQKCNCDCKESHKSNLFNLMVSIKIIAFMVSYIFLFFSLFSEGPGLLYGLIAGLSGIITFGSAQCHVRLYRRGWMKAHHDYVINKLIPEYLEGQINLMDTHLLGDYSRFEQAARAVTQVMLKGRNKQKFVQQFLSTHGGGEILPLHLVKMREEGDGCLNFAEVLDLLIKSERLVMVYLATKRKEVDKFKKSLSASIQQHEDYALAQEVWLREAEDICLSLNVLSLQFNRCLNENPVSMYCSAEELSKGTEVAAKLAKGLANNLLQELIQFYGKQDEAGPVGSVTEEPSKPDEDKVSETPALIGGILTRAELEELKDLEKDLERTK